MEFDSVSRWRWRSRAAGRRRRQGETWNVPIKKTVVQWDGIARILTNISSFFFYRACTEFYRVLAFGSFFFYKAELRSRCFLVSVLFLVSRNMFRKKIFFGRSIVWNVPERQTETKWGAQVRTVASAERGDSNERTVTGFLFTGLFSLYFLLFFLSIGNGGCAREEGTVVNKKKTKNSSNNNYNNKMRWTP